MGRAKVPALRFEQLENRIAPAVVTPFTPVFSANVTGDIAIIGNTLETASTVNNPGMTQQDVTNAQNAVGGSSNGNNDNNAWNMAYVNVNNTPGIFNSSQASLNLPSGAQVLYAGLYWGSVTTTAAQAAAENHVEFSTPTSGGLVSVTGSTVGSFNFTGLPPGSIYGSFANVTSLVKVAGNGTYEVANVQAALTNANGSLPYMGTYAGWSLVVAYSAPADPPRNLTVFDGYAVQQSTDPPLSVPISGFVAPPTGTVNAQVGVVSYEGDLAVTGDSMALNGTDLSDAVNPANNFMDSVISNQGVLITAKDPNYVNQMGFDAKVVNAPSGVIPNSATGATITFTTSGDGYFPEVFTTAIDLYSPDLVATKTVTDLSGSTTKPGDTLEYTINLTNSGEDAASDVVLSDPIPVGTTYVPGTLKIDSGANAGPKTDASGDDQAYYDASTDQVVFDLGSGATATAGGTLGINAETSISFEVQIDPGLPANTVINNQAEINYNGATTGFPLVSSSNVAAVTVVNSLADLALTKTVSNSTPNVGDQVTYTVTLTNNGPGPATGVTVEDLLPSGLRLDNAVTSQGAYDGLSGQWTAGSLTDGASATLTITATVISADPVTNTATITDSDSVDPDPSNNQASATETPQQADLAITKTVSDPTPNVGDTIVYTVTVADNGPNNATGVTVTDLLPSGLTFESSNVGTAYDPTTGLWTIGDIADGASAVLNITATVTGPNSEDNVATITSADQYDPNPGNNSAEATETPQQADLALSKTVSDPTPNVGDIITYTITVANDGPNAATGVVVQDILPKQVEYQSSLASEGSYDLATNTWTLGSVSDGATETLTITVKVTSPDPASNTATITHSDQYDPDPGNNSDTASINPQQADLALTKTVSDPTPNVGDTITYTVTLTDNGPNTATNAQVTDLLPAGLTFDSATPSEGTYDSSTGLWTVGTVTMTTPQTLQVVATVVSPNATTNTATITHSDQFDPDPGNNSASATETPQQADLELYKTVDNPTPNVGDTITYTVTLADNGPDNATDVTVSDSLPAGLTFVSATPSEGSYNPTTGLWTVGTVSPSVAQTLMVTALVVSPNPQTNTAAISHSDQYDPNTGNNSASVTEMPHQADLAITKTVSDSTPNIGETIVYAVTVTDNGPDSATDVQVSDLLPSGLAFVSAQPTLGTYNSSTGLWTVGTLNPGTPQTLQVVATVLSPNPQTNTATISHSDQYDPNPNNSATATETPQQADLAIAKTVNNPTPNVGDTITYTVTLTDSGPNEATGVMVSDSLPAGLTFVSDTPSEGSYNPTTGVWTVGTVTTTTPETLQVQATVVSPNATTNTATISHSEQYDPNPNNSASAIETPQQADLAIAKTVSDSAPNVGDTITYTVTLTDSGPNEATGVTVSDSLPAGLTFVSDTPSEGSYNPTTGVWTVGTVTTTTPETLQVQALVVSPNATTNTATISHSNQYDPYPNNSASATETPQQADLVIAKTVNNPTPNVGGTITYTVTLTDNGPNEATGVMVSDSLPTGLTFVSDTPSEGSYNPTTGAWTVGTVTTTTPETLQVQALVLSPNATTNTATISHSDQYDSSSGNNSASAIETPQQADLAITKTVSDPTPNVGDTITYIVTLTDNGPNEATGVTISDSLPAGLTFVSDTPSEGSYNPTTGIWTVGTVTTTPETLQVQALVVSPTATTNTATISHSDQYDPNTGNNSSSATETPQRANLALTKVASQSQVMEGQTVIYTLTVRDLGPSSATDVVVDDHLPSGLTFSSAKPSQGTFNNATGLWTVGTLADGASATLRVTDRVYGYGPIVNKAEVTALQVDPDLANNVATATVTGVGISKRDFLSSSDPPPQPPMPPLPTVSTLNSDVIFIEDLYQAMTGHDATMTELAKWLNFLLAGGSRSKMAKEI